VSARVAPVLFAAAAAGLVGTLVGGSLSPLTVVFLVATVVLAVWTRRARADIADSHWTAPIGTTGGDGRPSRGGAPSTRRTVAALARVEARELALSPWFGIGAGLCLTMVLAFAPSYEDESFVEIVDDLPFFAHVLVGMVVVACHRAVSRTERDGARELVDTCPTAPATRAWGVLAAGWLPVVALAVFFAAFMAVVDLFSTDVRAGGVGSADSATVAAGLALGAGGVALGAAIGRHLRFALAPLVALVVVGYVSLELAAGEPGEYEPAMLFSTFGALADDAPQLTASQAWVHLAWILAITAATVVVAIAPTGSRSRP
jgi:hypothetical protein